MIVFLAIEMEQTLPHSSHCFCILEVQTKFHEANQNVRTLSFNTSFIITPR